MPAQFQKLNRLVVTVPLAGTPVQVNSGLPLYVRSFVVQAHYANVGSVFFGDSAANAAAASAHALNPGDNFSLQGDNFASRDLQLDLSQLWVDASANNLKLIITYLSEVLH